MKDTSYQFICMFGSEESTLERELDANEAASVVVCMCSEQVSEFEHSRRFW